MITITQPDAIRSTASAQRLVSRMPDQIRFAAAGALNTALRAGQRREQERMAQVFDRPTPFVLRRGIALSAASKTRLEGQIAVDTADRSGDGLPAGKPLLAEVAGGARRAKRSEVLLQRKGVLPSGYLTVPGRGARLDAYGGIARGQVLEILSWFQTYAPRAEGQRTKAWRDNLTDKGRARKRAGTRHRAGVEYFLIRPGDKGGLSPGIYARRVAGRRFMGPTARPRAVLVFVRRAVYAQRLDFIAQAEQAINAALPDAFATAMRRALETAR